MKIYLAGGTRGNWRELLELNNQNTHEFFNIMGIQRKSLSEIARLEMTWLRSCDGVLAWFPEDNPSGIGLAAELGYAKALGKTTVLVYDHLHKRVEWLRHIVDFEHKREPGTGLQYGVDLISCYAHNRKVTQIGHKV